jgi:hypothetical protein
MPVLSAVIVAAAVVWCGVRIAAALERRGSSSGGAQTGQLLALFAPGIDAVRQDPRALLTWQPLAAAARTLFPAEFSALDAAAGGTFPFTRDRLEAAHARWSADWLVWEGTHDSEYKLRAAAAQEDLGDRAGSPYGRTRLESIEREKLERYQQRYEEYTRVSKALQALIAAMPVSRSGA